MNPLDLIAACGFGLESVVAAELRALGYRAKILQNGRILFHGDAAAICRANLWLRSADRVLIRVASFPAQDFGQLFDGARDAPWEAWLPRDAAFPVQGRSVRSKLTSVPACQKIVKKAVAARLQHAWQAEVLPETGAAGSIEVALLEDRVTLTLDTTGPGLHKRGYRTLVGEANLRETLAAGLVLLSPWQPGQPLIDPFCGTGAVPIEAAMIARNLAPGRMRQFAAESWPTLDAKLWQAARDEAKQLERPAPGEPLLGSDIDAEVLSLARYHAKQAGVADLVQFSQRDFLQLSSPRPGGSVICNPPYGERLGEQDEMIRLHRQMPRVFARLPDWSFNVLTGYAGFQRLTGLPAKSQRKLYNGRLECRYFQFRGDFWQRMPETVVDDVDATAESNETEPTRRRAKTKPAKETQESAAERTARQAQLFAVRLAKTARHLRKWPSRGVTCYRLYERDVPELPFTVDRYEDWLHVVEHDRPHDRTPQEHADWLQAMAAAAASALDAARSQTSLKTLLDKPRPLSAQFETVSPTLIAQEAGLKFQVNLLDCLDTGLLLDQRNLRAMIRKQAAGKRVLNLFAYTGAASMAAAVGGAATTTTVDLFPQHLAWAEANLQANGCSGPQHRRICQDGLTLVEQHAPGDHFDIAVLSPPLASDRSSGGDDWDLQRDCSRLLVRLFELLGPRGMAYLVVTCRRFKLHEAALGGLAVREISSQTVPEDFRNKRIHRCWRITRPASLR